MPYNLLRIQETHITENKAMLAYMPVTYDGIDMAEATVTFFLVGTCVPVMI